MFGLRPRLGGSDVATLHWVWLWVLVPSDIITKIVLLLFCYHRRGCWTRRDMDRLGHFKPQSETNGRAAIRQCNIRPYLSCFCLALTTGLLSVYTSLAPWLSYIQSSVPISELPALSDCSLQLNLKDPVCETLFEYSIKTEMCVLHVGNTCCWSSTSD